jgi:hypothetical protein
VIFALSVLVSDNYNKSWNSSFEVRQYKAFIHKIIAIVTVQRHS